MVSLLRRRLLRWTCALLVSALPALGSGADDPLQSLLPPKDSPTHCRLLVLKTGQILQGEVEARLGGYTVSLPTGSIVVPYEQVRTAAESLEDAYARISRAMRAPNANDHLEVARWCARVGLPDAAREQAVFALQLEPNRDEARALLVQLQRPGVSARPVAAASAEFQPAPSLAAEGSVLPATPAGLSGERVGEYVRQIQPLLLSSCATSACHGGTNAGSLQLRSSGRITRHDSDVNLAAVLRFIDTRNPDASPLVALPRQAAGPHAAAFRGPKSREHIERLLTWTRLVAREFAALPAGDIIPASGVTRSPRVVPAGGLAEAPANDAALPDEGIPESVPAASDAFLRRVLDNARPDPFDPAEFNRRMHGLSPVERQSR